MTPETYAPLAVALIATAAVKAFRLPAYPHQIAVFVSVFWLVSIVLGE